MTKGIVNIIPRDPQCKVFLSLKVFNFDNSCVFSSSSNEQVNFVEKPQ